LAVFYLSHALEDRILVFRSISQSDLGMYAARICTCSEQKLYNIAISRRAGDVQSAAVLRVDVVLDCL
jgi:hypothetical protein